MWWFRFRGRRRVCCRVQHARRGLILAAADQLKRTYRHTGARCETQQTAPVHRRRRRMQVAMQSAEIVVIETFRH